MWHGSTKINYTQRAQKIRIFSWHKWLEFFDNNMQMRWFLGLVERVKLDMFYLFLKKRFFQVWAHHKISIQAYTYPILYSMLLVCPSVSLLVCPYFFIFKMLIFFSVKGQYLMLKRNEKECNLSHADFLSTYFSTVDIHQPLYPSVYPSLKTEKDLQLYIGNADAGLKGFFF